MNNQSLKTVELTHLPIENMNFSWEGIRKFQNLGAQGVVVV